MALTHLSRCQQLLCTQTLQAKPDVHSCDTLRIPDSISDLREFVGVRFNGSAAASHMHQLQLLECPADLWFLHDVTRSSDSCVKHSAAMMAACSRWCVPCWMVGHQVPCCMLLACMYAHSSGFFALYMLC